MKTSMNQINKQAEFLFFRVLLPIMALCAILIVVFANVDTLM